MTEPHAEFMRAVSRQSEERTDLNLRVMELEMLLVDCDNQLSKYDYGSGEVLEVRQNIARALDRSKKEKSDERRQH